MPTMPTAVVSHCPQIALPTQVSIYMCVMLPRPEERLLFPSQGLPLILVFSCELFKLRNKEQVFYDMNMEGQKTKELFSCILHEVGNLVLQICG